jgi:hypothetical protein
MMKAVQRIGTIERQYPNEWVVVEVTQVDRANQARAGRVLAHSADEAEITRLAIRLRQEWPLADLWTFYTGARIPEDVTVVLGCR